MHFVQKAQFFITQTQIETSHRYLVIIACSILTLSRRMPPKKRARTTTKDEKSPIEEKFDSIMEILKESQFSHEQL